MSDQDGNPRNDDPATPARGVAADTKSAAAYHSGHDVPPILPGGTAPPPMDPRPFSLLPDEGDSSDRERLPIRLRTTALVVFLLAGVLVIAIFGAIRDSHRRTSYKDALAVYEAAIEGLNHLVPDQTPPDRGAHVIAYDDVRKATGNLEVWDWANQTTLAARRVALGAARMAAAASAVKEESAVAADMRVDAEVLAANAVSLGRNFDEAFAAATLDSSLEVLANRLASEATKAQPSAPTAGLSKQDTTTTIIAPPKIASRRLRFFVAQGRVQKRIGADVLTKGQALDKDVSITPDFLTLVLGAFSSDLASSVWSTLFISAALALIVLACATPAAYVVKKIHGTPGNWTDFKGSDLATLAIAATPLLATPFLVASLASGGSGDASRGGPGDGGLSGPRSSISNASSILTNNYADMRTDGSSSLAPLLASLEQQRAEDTRTRESVLQSLRTGQRNVEVLTSQLTRTVAGLTNSVTVSQNLTRDLIVAEQRTASRDRTILLGSLEKSDAVITQAKVSLDQLTKVITADSQSAGPQMSTITAVAWMDECLRLSEGKRAAPVRAFRWLIGSAEKTDLMSKMVNADANSANLTARALCRGE